jgi:hypothetical protein
MGWKDFYIGRNVQKEFRLGLRFKTSCKRKLRVFNKKNNFKKFSFISLFHFLSAFAQDSFSSLVAKAAAPTFSKLFFLGSVIFKLLTQHYPLPPSSQQRHK